MKVTGVPLVVGALGTLAKAQGKRLKTNGIKTKITELQKTVLMYTSRILWKVNEVWGVLFTPFFKNITYLLVEINLQLFSNNDDDDDDDDDDNNDHNNNKKKKKNYPKTRKYWFDVQQGIVSSHGEKDPL